MSTEWDSIASGWDNDPAVRAYATSAFVSLERIPGWESLSFDGSRVLDFGCGTGVLTELFVDAGATVHAIDTSDAMLEVLRSKQHLFTDGQVVADSALPEAGSLFDLVVCSSVCSFLDDYPSAMRELVAFLAPGGWLVQWDWERVAGDTGGLARNEIVEALIGAGLDRVGVEIGFTCKVGESLMSPLMGSGRRPHSAPR